MTNTPLFIRPHLTLDEARKVRELLDHHMASQANWMESALIHGNTGDATELAKERDFTRNIFAKFNGGIMELERRAEEAQKDVTPATSGGTV